MQNVNVGVTVTQILPAAPRAERIAYLQNQSDTTLYLALNDTNAVLLTASLGLKLEPGDSLILSGANTSQGISAIHGATGTKVLHYQFL